MVRDRVHKVDAILKAFRCRPRGNRVPAIGIDGKTERLLVHVVLFAVVAKCGVHAVGPATVALEIPAGEDPCTGIDVVLGVVVDPDREELHQLPGVVLLRQRLEIGVSVEPRDHGWVLGDGEQQVAEVAKGVLAKQLELSLDAVCVLGGLRGQGTARRAGTELAGDLAEPCGEVVVPEQRHLLLQRALGVDHAEDPALRRIGDPRVRPRTDRARSRLGSLARRCSRRRRQVTTHSRRACRSQLTRSGHSTPGERIAQEPQQSRAHRHRVRTRRR